MAADCKAVVVAVLLSTLQLFSYGVGSNSQRYEENLFIRDVPGGKVLAFFTFKTTWHITPEEIHKDATGNLPGRDEAVRWVSSFTAVHI